MTFYLLIVMVGAFFSLKRVGEEMGEVTRMGLRRAYLLAALQGNWDERVPSLIFVAEYLKMCVLTMRLPRSRNAAVLARTFHTLVSMVLRPK
jgi:hypothetical protein